MRKGKVARLSPSMTWNLGLHFAVQLDHTFENFDVHDGRLYTANLSRARLVWQFDTRMFVRGIIQYVNVDANADTWDSDLLTPGIQPHNEFRERSGNLFSQLLFSYKLNPQTVFFAGYSDIRESFTDIGVDGRELERISLTERNRTVFLKIGYAWLV